MLSEHECPAQMYLHEGGYYDHEEGLTKLIDQNFMEQAPKALDKMFLGATMPEDVRQYFSLKAKRDQAEQQKVAADKALMDYEDQMYKLLTKVTQTGDPVVAKMPNGDTYIMFDDSRNGPTVEKVQVVNL